MFACLCGNLSVFYHSQLHFFKGIFEVGDVSTAGTNTVISVENETHQSSGGP